MQILIAHQHVDVREAVRSRLEETFDRRLTDVIFNDARNEVEALKMIERQRHDPFDVLITAWELPYDRNTAAEQGGGGLRLVSALAGLGHAGTKCFVVSPLGLKSSGIAVAGVACTFLEAGPSLFDELTRIAENDLEGVRRRPRLSVIFKQDPGTQNWNYWLDGGPEFPANDQGAIPVFTRALLRLAENSVPLGTTENWVKELASIGDDLRKNIFERDPNFLKSFNTAIRVAGGIHGARFSFSVNEQIYPLMLEGLVGAEPGTPTTKLDPDKVDFWMLRAPIYRSLAVDDPGRTYTGRSRTPLFEDGRHLINCLIIEADASGSARIPEHPQTLQELTNVRNECNALEYLLRANRTKLGVSEIRRLCRATLPKYKTFKQHLQEVLESKPWHLVHFSGHSAYGDDGAGYLFLPGPEIEVLEAKYFASWLSSAQLLFLSSCHSSTANFVREMARMRIPAVVGFRWDIDDRAAEQYARWFYENLFHHQSIETAFVEARLIAYKKLGFNARIWAAPMLVLLESSHTNTAAAA